MRATLRFLFVVMLGGVTAFSFATFSFEAWKASNSAIVPLSDPSSYQSIFADEPAPTSWGMAPDPATIDISIPTGLSGDYTMGFFIEAKTTVMVDASQAGHDFAFSDSSLTEAGNLLVNGGNDNVYFGPGMITIHGLIPGSNTFVFRLFASVDTAMVLQAQIWDVTDNQPAVLATPEPAPLAALAIGVVGFIVKRRRRLLSA